MNISSGVVPTEGALFINMGNAGRLVRVETLGADAGM
jgi:hypothetical protein